ncbi:MAG: DNA-3-methyladenine glycosylase 2 family protein [Alphaproteobacteria bacterium]|nr:DNA-3-methyladenine glycosylase 2 family protein [Alphaproteobacteria bacterium]
MTQLDPRACYRALEARDPRFDGRFFVGVTSTGIYCRPVCPARTPKPANCRFFATAAAAQEAGFRPCLRCRPETAPDTGAWRGTSATVSRGLALIAEGALDGDDASVERLAARLGVGERQLRRLFTQHLGASPIAVAQTRRVHLAKHLIHETRLPMAEVALASGFGSIRRFNETFRALFRKPPSALRRRTVTALPEGSAVVSGVTVRLSYRPPYDWPAMLAFLADRTIAGIDEVVREPGGETYRRTVLIDGVSGTVEIRHLPQRHGLAATIRLPSLAALPSIIQRIRRVFDLGADVATIGQHLARDRLLAPLVAARPGLRAPGAWDGFETAVRAVLGQQVSVQAARRLAGQLVRICGTPLDLGLGAGSVGGTLTHAFPTAAQLAAADLTALGMPGARKKALRSLAEAALADPHLFQPLATVEETVARLSAISGIGDWTAHYIALRAVRETDAFPASDIGILRGAAVNGTRPKPAELTLRAEPWRPWRAYAAQHLWAADAARSQDLPPSRPARGSSNRVAARRGEAPAASVSASGPHPRTADD